MVIFALTSAVNNPPLGNTAPLFIGLLVVGIGTRIVAALVADLSRL